MILLLSSLLFSNPLWASPNPLPFLTEGSYKVVSGDPAVCLLSDVRYHEESKTLEVGATYNFRVQNSITKTASETDPKCQAVEEIKIAQGKDHTALSTKVQTLCPNKKTEIVEELVKVFKDRIELLETIAQKTRACKWTRSAAKSQ